MEEKRYFTVREMVKEKDCPLSEFMLRKLIDEKKLPHIKAGKKFIIDKERFAEWVQNQQ